MILHISLSIKEVEDSIYWWPNKTGLYKVKEAYHLLTSVEYRVVDTRGDNLWLKLWKLQVPPKVLDLMWRATSRCLPTKVRLSEKNIQLDTGCIVCQDGVESDVHILFDCSFAKECWHLSGLSSQVPSSSSVYGCISSLFHLLNDDQCALLSMVCWAIWKHRNEVLWNGVYMYARRTVCLATSLLTSW